MGELVLLEEGLFKVYKSEDNKEQIVSGRELHEFLEVKTKYNDWIKRMLEYGFDENIDYLLVTQKRETNNPKNPYTSEINHYIKMDMAKEISMIQRNEKGKQARQYFISIEKKYNEQNNLANLSIEDIIIQNALALKETRLKQEEHDRKLKELELQSTTVNNKVTSIQDYMVKEPDFKTLETAINKYTRLSGKSYADARADVYKKFESIHGIHIKARVKNAKERIQSERVGSGKKPYSDSTLNGKVNGVKILQELNMVKDTVEIVMGMIMELEK